MGKQVVFRGTAANDGTGDNLRLGAQKINENFTELYTALGDGSTLASGNYVTTSASDQFKIAFWRNTADGHVTCYYRGVSVRVYAGGRTDWSGHGYVTHSSEVLLTMSSTTNGRSHVVSNQGFSYLQNNSSNMRFTGTTWSYDSNYLYATFRYDTNESGTGWRPYYNVEVIDNDGIVQSVVGV